MWNNFGKRAEKNGHPTNLSKALWQSCYKAVRVKYGITQPEFFVPCGITEVSNF